MAYLSEAILDFNDDDPFNKTFVLNNPNAKMTCGCGTSFSM
jgi:Fe-S cluster assembly iron-binding protein IscA